MAYTTINKSTDYFNTVTYSGNGSNNHTITGVGFNADFVWNKLRSGNDDHRLFDKVRGINKYVESSNATVEVTDAILSTNSDGYVLTDAGEVNSNTGTYVSWNWIANGQGSSNTDGSINTTYTSVNTTAGLSIVTYTGTGSNATIGHGLGVAPKMIIIKSRNYAKDWTVYHASLGNTKWLELNGTAAEQTNSNRWNNTSPTNQVFSVGVDSGVNGSGYTYVAYCFAEKTGYSKFGSYVGNDNNDGSFIYTGFKPAFVMIKKTNETNDWFIQDNKRLGYNAANYYLEANTNLAEQAYSDIDLVSNGFKCRSTGGGHNDGNYIYMAIGQSLVGTNNIPATAR